MALKATPKIRRGGAYLIKSADGGAESVDPNPVGPPVEPLRPSDADKALVAALLAGHSG
jgi:hypothetical protein